MTVFAVMLAGFYHLMHWDNYSPKVIALQAKDLVGMNTAEDFESFALICKARGMMDCYVDNYGKAHRLAPDQPELAAEYGIALGRSGASEQAMTVLKGYIEKGGQNLDAAFDYAKMLGAAGELKEASKIFKFIIDAKPGILQVTVMNSFIGMLMDAGQYKQVIKEINTFRREAKSLPTLMNAELEEARKALKPKGRKSARRSKRRGRSRRRL